MFKEDPQDLVVAEGSSCHGCRVFSCILGVNVRPMLQEETSCHGKVTATTSLRTELIRDQDVGSTPDVHVYSTWDTLGTFEISVSVMHCST